MGKREQEKAASKLAKALRESMEQPTYKGRAPSKADQAKEIAAMEEVEKIRQKEKARAKRERETAYQREHQRKIRTQRKEPYRPFLN